MILAMIFRTLAEAAMIGFVIWGFVNESKLVSMEDGIRRMLRRNSAQQ